MRLAAFGITAIALTSCAGAGAPRTSSCYPNVSEVRGTHLPAERCAEVNGSPMRDGECVFLLPLGGRTCADPRDDIPPAGK